MNQDTDFPAIYRASDKAAAAAQSSHLCAIRGHSALLVIGAAASAAGTSTPFAAYCAALLFLGAIFLSLYIALQGFEKRWYRARAVAESVKTSSWRFAMRAEPYEDVDDLQKVKAKFRNLLRNILSEHSDLASDFAGIDATGDQITDKMCELRAQGVESRLAAYKKDRISEQRDWYSKKAASNRRHARFWFTVFVILQAGAVACVVGRILKPGFEHWPTEVFVVAAGVVFAWIHVKRYREISAAYALTAHEIGIIAGESEKVRTDHDLSEFVQNSENAFSREHTQWIARKDVL
jgi:hypothetical protein